jgi:2-aminoadipate transaminase
VSVPPSSALPSSVPPAAASPSPVLPSSGVISFARGVPSPDLFPVRELAEASRLAFARDSATALNYGPPAGYRPLQERLGDLHGAAPDRVVITPGSYILLSLLVRVLARSGPVLVEAPTYDRVNNLLRQAGARVAEIPRGRDGIDLAALERHLTVSAAGTVDPPAFLYVMPTVHNPTGTTMPPPDRERLADLAVRHGLLLVEDDPYGRLRFGGEPVASLRDLLEARGAGHLSVFASSFSKTVAPGLRVGYGVLPEHLAGPVTQAALETYVSPPLWPQAVVHEFLGAGFLPAHLARVRAMLRERCDVLTGRLEAGLGEQARWSVPDGGYFLWLELPEALRAVDLLAQCEQAGVTFAPGSGFFYGSGSGAGAGGATGGGAGGEHSARLCFSFPSVADIRAGADRLTAAARRLLNDRPPELPDEEAAHVR